MANPPGSRVRRSVDWESRRRMAPVAPKPAQSSFAFPLTSFGECLRHLFFYAILAVLLLAALSIMVWIAQGDYGN